MEEFVNFDSFGKPKAIIVDIDGTLTQGPLTHRGMFEFEKSIKDVPNNTICELVRSLSFTYFVIIITSREVKYKHFTENWLQKHVIPCIELHMKQNDDKRPSADAKEEIYHELKKRYHFVLALDDQQEIIQMWNRNGLYTILV